MEKAMTILYEVHKGLYVNLTNKCPCACTFCIRQNKDTMDDKNTLWLEHDVTEEELLMELRETDLSKYDELVFCGFGEPTEALEVMLAGAKYVKSFTNMPIRLNTNGLGNLIHERDITEDLEGWIDTVSISLNNPDPAKYQELVRSKFGEKSFNAMLEFAKNCKEHVDNVIMSTVSTTISEEEEKRCQEICNEIGVTYRIRPYES